MAFIYNLTDSWNDVTTTWNGIKLAVTNTSSDASSKLLNLTVSGATTASFVVDKSGNLDLNGKVNKVTITAPATAATFTLADGSTFATVGGYATTFTFSAATSLTFPTSGTVTALGNTTTGSGSIVLATSPTLVTPNLGTPSAATLTNATGLPVGGISATGTPSASTYLRGDGSWTSVSVADAIIGPASSTDNAIVRFDGTTGKLAQNSAVTIADTTGDITGGKYNGLTVSTTTGTLTVANGKTLATDNSVTFVGTDSSTVNYGTGGTIAYTGGTLAQFASTTSAQLAGVISDETGTGSLVFSNSPTFNDDITLGVSATATGSAKFVGTTSGIVTLSVADAAGTWTMKLPTSAGTNGYYLQTDGLGNTTWAAGGGGGGGSPGGSNTQVQFNDSGSFGGDTGFTYDKTTDAVTIGVASTSTGALKLANASSANLVTVQSGNNSAAWSMTLPTSAGTNGYLLQTDGSGVTSWVTPPATGLTVGSTAISGGTSGRILYDNAGTLGEKTVTGTGDVVLATSPTLVTPTLGVASATSVNKVAITAPATGSTLTIADGKTLTASNTLTFTGTDSSSVAFGTGGTVAYTGGTLAQFASTTSAQLAGVISDETGSGALVFGTSPTFTTSAIFPAGSVSAPGITTTGDTNTGIYFPAADSVSITTGGAAALTVSSSQNVSVAGTLAMGSSFLRNRIINGDMRIDQRAAGTVTPTSGGYRIDRFETTAPAASKYSVQQSSTAPTGFVNSLLITSLSAYTVGASEAFVIQQQIEGTNISDLAWGTASAKTVTLSFWVRSSLTGTFGGSLRNSDNSRSYPFSYTISSAGTWEQKSVTIAGDTTGTWLTTTGSGIKTAFSFGAGATVSGTAGSWAAANYSSATSATSVVGTNGATFYITGVQLEVGSAATPFERLNYQQQLSQCQRYYFKSVAAGSALPFFFAYNNDATTVRGVIYFPQTMRIGPSAMETTGTAADYAVLAAAGSANLNAVPTLAQVQPDCATVQGTVASGLTTGQASIMRSGSAATNSYLGFTAEL
jgi:hypothetical protein